METCDILVIGAGHAGCEAALACARMGLKTLLITLNLDAVALMPCNPAIGGTAKGHLVREVDALGGEMGLAIDETFLQSRMLNTGKGPAVHSLRAQADKLAYRLRMRRALDEEPNLTLIQGEIRDILARGGRVSGATTTTGEEISCRAAVACCGVYLGSRILIGDRAWEGGPQGLMPSTAFSKGLSDLGFPMRRFKTGTPARLDGRTIDHSKMEIQTGDEPVVPFSFMTDRKLQNRAACYLTYTTPETHRIIRDHLHLAPSYSGLVRGVGARYCPSIEDKVVRFADKDRHPVFLEPEGAGTVEWYAQGLSTGMPEAIQKMIYRSVPGLENARLMRLAYAIEYDCIDPTALDLRLQARHLPGFFGAGQLNGTSGYEEAAAQGLFAGINAALYVKGEPPLTLTRSQAYLGVLVDDLVTKGVDEPYRMMTSRAEYRLLLRQDNADLRLTQLGHRVGLASDARLNRAEEKARESEAAENYLRETPANDALCAAHGAKKGTKLDELLRRPEISARSLPGLENFSPAALEQAEISIKYEGYLERQARQIQRFDSMEARSMPGDIDYAQIASLRVEARQKLSQRRPASLGEAMRIPGVSPGDAAVLMVLLDRHEREDKGA